MRVSPVSRNRVSAIRNPSYSGGSKAVEGVEKVKAIENTSGQYLNYEYGKEAFYDKLEEHRKPKSDFDKKKEEEKKTYQFSKEELELIKTIKNVLHNFNVKIDTLKTMDSIRKTSVFEKAKKVINENSHFLSTLGIYIDKSFHFYIKDEEFAKSVFSAPNKLTLLTDPINGVLRKITTALMA